MPSALRRLASPFALPLAGAALLAVLPLFVEAGFARHLIIIAMIYAIVASNWDLTLGYGGIFNFAHLAFFGIGAYAAAILAKTAGWPPLLAIPMGGLAAVLAAVLVSLPILRLRGIYVILVTFAFSQLAVQIIVSQAHITGGSLGMTFLPGIRIGDHDFVRDGRIGYYYLTLATLIASTALLHWFVRSRTGMALVALRDQEDYARARGVSIVRTRLVTLAVSALFTGVAGGLFAIYLRVAAPNVFGFEIMALALSMLLVGGAGTINGPIAAAFLLTFVAEALVGIGAWRHVLIAAMIVLVLLRFPGGLDAAFTHLRGKIRGEAR